MLNFLINYKFILFALLVVCFIIGYGIRVYIKRPTDEQLNKIKEWLLYAVTEAEKELGSGTGKIKLRYVYDMFLTKFPYMSQIISFENFSILVDEALAQFKELVNSNEAVKKYVE